MMRELVGTNRIHVAVAHANTYEEGKKFKDRIAAEFDCIEDWLTDFSPIMAYATGAGVLAITFFKE